MGRTSLSELQQLSLSAEEGGMELWGTGQPVKCSPWLWAADCTSLM